MKRSLTKDISAVNVTSSTMKPVFLARAEHEALSLKHYKKEADEINKSHQSLLPSTCNNHSHNHNHHNNNNLKKPSDSDRHRDRNCDRDRDRDRDYDRNRDRCDRDREREEDAKSREHAWLEILAERERMRKSSTPLKSST